MFRTLDTFDTEFSADSVEWCPVEPFRDVFVCGTYQLTKDEENQLTKSQKRLGRIYLFRVINDGRLKLLHQLDVPAVLDMKWAHIAHYNKILLGVVNSTGCLQIYQLHSEEDERLQLVFEKKIDENEEVLALSLDWCSGRWDESKSDLKIVVSDSKGSISLFQVHEENLERIARWHAHEFEAWIAAFDYWDTNIVYTGGDDCKFQRFDLREEAHLTASNRVHNAGVTSIHSNAKKQFLLATGSYDEILRLWDTRNCKRSLSHTNLLGGVWRSKWDPFSCTYLLTACMYGGFKVVNCKNEEMPSVVGEYTEHESISYGCDWSLLKTEDLLKRSIHRSEEKNVALLATCSFYDHLLRLPLVIFEDD